MTKDQLRMWMERMGYENTKDGHQAAASALGLTISGFRNQLYGHRPVSAQTDKIAWLLLRLGKEILKTKRVGIE